MTKQDKLFLDLLALQFKKNGKLEVDNYNTAQRICLDYMNSGLFKDFCAGRYSLFQLNYGNHLVIMDVIDHQVSDNLYIDQEFLESLNKKFGISIDEALYKLVDEVNSIIYPENSPNFMQRRKYLDNLVSIQNNLSDYDIELRSEFFESSYAEDYNFNFNPRPLKSLLQEKLGEKPEIKIEYDKKFSDHYQKIKSKIKFPYPEYLGTDNEFSKINHFVNSELHFSYMGMAYSGDNELINTRENSWVYIEDDNIYSGGALILNDVMTEVPFISLKEKINDSKNYVKIVNFIANHEQTKRDLFLTDPTVISKGLESQIRDNNPEKRIYFNEEHKHLFYKVIGFVDKNNLENRKENILNLFYKELILKNQSNQENLFKIESKEFLENFFRDVTKKYQNEMSNEFNLSSRDGFLKYCFTSHCNENFSYTFVCNDITGTNLSFTQPQEDNYDEDVTVLYEDIVKFTENNFGNLTFDLKKDLYLDVVKNLQQYSDYNRTKKTKEYSYHALYDFLTDNNIIHSDKSLVKVYRFEMADGLGVYRYDKNPDEQMLSKNDETIYNYAQRKLPSRDKNLCTLFLRADVRGDMVNFYNEKYQFGFSSKDQINNWFTSSERMVFEKNSVRIYEYEVQKKDIIQSDVQLAFRIGKYQSKKEIKFENIPEIDTVQKKQKQNKNRP